MLGAGSKNASSGPRRTSLTKDIGRGARRPTGGAPCGAPCRGVHLDWRSTMAKMSRVGFPQKKCRRFVLFFLRDVLVERSGHSRGKQLFTVTASSAETAYRKVTKWKGKIAHSGGYMDQMPVRKVEAYLPWGKDESTLDHIERVKKATMPSLAYVVPLGKW